VGISASKRIVVLPVWALAALSVVIAVAIAASLLIIAGNAPVPATSVAAYTWRLPDGFPLPYVPADNPMTDAKVALGRYLFYDARLSGNETQSCSSCHQQARAFSDGRAQAVGSTGEMHPRNAMTLTNAAYNASYNWADPTLHTIEDQLPLPMFGTQPVEMGITGNEAAILARLRDDARYTALFAAAFPAQPDPFTFDNIQLALAAFTRTLISGNSPYDAYLRGDEDAISASAERGMRLFSSERLPCQNCHMGFNLSIAATTAEWSFDRYFFANIGLYNVDGAGAYPMGSQGAYEATGDPADMGAFRPPTLRNIALTAPYMHDGSIATLREVIDTYSQGGRNIINGAYAGDGRANPYKSLLISAFTLTDAEMDDLLAFLDSLTDETFISDPALSDPFTTG
jgi:cytochrome c peroxidase